MKKTSRLKENSVHFGFYATLLKRPLDLVISLLLLILLSPILLILCLLVRLKLGSPVFFLQERAGKEEKTFRIIKFRTMTNARDKNGDLLPDTDRFTRFGNFLRNSSLDELPELLNVVKGDMSLVGPRPLYTFYLPYYTEEESVRHAVRGGITGLAQINGRALCRWKDRFAYDVDYVRSISFFGDIKILFQTVSKVFRRSDIGVPSVTDEGGLHVLRDVQRPEYLKAVGSSYSKDNFSRKCTDYPHSIAKVQDGEHAIFLSSGRSCIREILKRIGSDSKTALLPSFTCESVLEPFLEQEYRVYPYALNSDLHLDIPSMEKQILEHHPAVILYHSYFGYPTCNGLKELLSRCNTPDLTVIADETQSMFSGENNDWADFRIGSIRKWGPFPDGAYLVGQTMPMLQPTDQDDKLIQLETNAMSMKQAFLDGRTKSEEHLLAFEDCRRYLDQQKNTYAMSSISNAVVRETDMLQGARIRRKNAGILLDGLVGLSCLVPVFQTLPDSAVPFMFPVLVNRNRKELQNCLAKEKIYATVIWACPDYFKDKIRPIEMRIYQEILCIPCDQRYDEIDMLRIVKTIRKYDEKENRYL